MSDNSTASKIIKQCDALKALLLEKNVAYGDSVFSPCHIFAGDLTPEQQLCVRIDDKINRFMCGEEWPGDDNLLDLTGYLILLLAMRDSNGT